MKLKKELKAVISQREILLKTGKSLADEKQMKVILLKFKNHLETYPNIKEGSLKKYLQKNFDNLCALIPKNKGAETRIEKLRKMVWEG